MNHSFFLQALGWALLNSLWQFGLLWFFFYLLTRSFRKLSSPFKHGFALLLCVAGTGWFLVNLVTSYQDQDSSTPLTSWLPSMEKADSAYFMLNRSLQSFREHYLGYVTLLYLLVIVLQFGLFFYSLYRSHSVYSAGLSKAAVDIRLYVKRMALQLNIKRQVQVFISEYVDTPLVIGFLKPTILMPLACMNQLSMAQLEAILLHELAHIKRNDYLVNIWVAFVEILFFFNPFARMLLHSVKQEREYTCDDWVMQYQFNAHQYASALLMLEKSRIGYLQSGVAATGSSRKVLLHRVQRILQVPAAEPVAFSRLAVCLAGCALFGFLSLKPSRTGEEKPLPENTLSFISPRLPARKLSFVEYPLPIASSRADLMFPLNPVKKQPVKLAKPATEPLVAEEQEALIIPASVTEDISRLTEPQEAVNVENRNFSIPEIIQPELPAAALVSGFPYVPSSSFYFSVDTLKPMRTETYHEQAARESLLKTQKALNEIDWAAIQKRLPSHSRASIQILKKELEQSFNRLNWQRINEAVKDSIIQYSDKQYKAVLYNELTELKKYKTQQQQLENLQNQLQLQQKVYSREAERKSLELQKQLAESKIIIYL
ncbi:MAG: M56 family metallopeptidase [Williamsia sp.]|nr:M56 family metallopeptidase [Williamsia sp.]